MTSQERHCMKILVLGLGNEILCDDGVGIYVSRELKKTLANREDISVAEASLAGLGLLDLLTGYDKAIVIDAIQTGEGKAGEVYRLNSNDFAATRHTASTHNINFASALELGNKLGLSLPREIVIFAIEVSDVCTFSETCTPKVKRAIPKCVNMVLKELNEKP
jgi:hydrogenase maturation protease